MRLSKSKFGATGGFRSFALEGPRLSKKGVSGQMSPNEKTRLYWANRRREISKTPVLQGVSWSQAVSGRHTAYR
jgi:hypothetical protein